VKAEVNIAKISFLIFKLPH